MGERPGTHEFPLPAFAGASFAGMTLLATGSVLGIVFTVNAVVIVILLLVPIPLLIFYRDVRKTLTRFDLLNTIRAISPTDAACFEEAKEVFASPQTYVFVYRHTHNASLRRLGEGIVFSRTRQVPPIPNTIIIECL